MARRSVVVQGGGEDLYEIDDSGGTYYTYKVKVGFISNSRQDIGKARSLEDALALIKSHSGREIKEIK